jgi:RNA-directed DNA polymerase
VTRDGRQGVGESRSTDEAGEPAPGHESIAAQHKALSLKLRGHFEYYGITGNSKSLSAFRTWATHIWKKWLGRRSQCAQKAWDWMNRLRERFPLPQVVVVHSCLRRMARA